MTEDTVDRLSPAPQTDVRTYAAQVGPHPWDERLPLSIARERAGFLALAGRQVSGSFNLAQTVRQSLRACVPQLADWAQLLLVDSGQAGYTSLVLGGDLLEARLPGTNRAELLGARLPGNTRTEPLETQLPGSNRTEPLEARLPGNTRTELLHVSADGPEPDGLAALVPDGAMRAQVAALRPADLLALPLAARGATFGSLTVARRAGFGFAEEDISLVEELAARIALALDAAQRYAERSAVVSVLRNSLRPPRLPTLRGVALAARCRPALDTVDIGGEFYDVWGHDDEWSVVLGDVSGKGVEAAVVTGQARHTVRGAAAVDRHPSAVLRALNSLLYDGTETGRHVTAVYGRVRPLDSGGLLAEVASAGHPAPLVIRADGTASSVPVRGPAAGLISDTLYRASSVHLHPGDTMLLYTDGVTEAGDHDPRAGTNRLTVLAASFAGAHPEAIVAAVETDALERAEHGHRDDITVLAIQSAS